MKTIDTETLVIKVATGRGLKFLGTDPYNNNDWHLGSEVGHKTYKSAIWIPQFEFAFLDDGEAIDYDEDGNVIVIGQGGKVMSGDGVYATEAEAVAEAIERIENYVDLRLDNSWE